MAAGISKEQKKLLHVAARELNLDDDLYREILRQEAGVTSSKNLDPAGFDKVMKRFKQLGFEKSGKPYRRPSHPFGGPNPFAKITEGMMYKIEMLYREIGMTDKKRQIEFNRRVCKKPWPQSRMEGNQIIEALKSMAARGYRAGKGGD
ncbi:MAG: regulatory protein GemA [Peptococcaceae bacterium]|nr:regulatory protein GemA [Peptococcaceae bacterium]